MTPQETAYKDLLVEVAELRSRVSTLEKTVVLLRKYDDFFWTVVFDVAGQIIKLTDKVNAFTWSR